MAREATTEYSAQPRPRCEYGKTPFFEGECQKAGEVLQSDGSMLCIEHAKLIRLEEREYTLLNRAYELDRWLDQPHNRADDLHWRRVRREREETVEDLRFNRTLIEGCKKGT